MRSSEQSGRLHIKIAADVHSDLLDYSHQIDEPMTEIASAFIRRCLAERAIAS